MGDLLFLLTSTAIIQLDTLIATENQNKSLIELLKATTKNEN